MQRTRYSCQTLMKIEFSEQISEKCSNIKLLKIRSVTAELFHAEEQTDILYMMEPTFVHVRGSYRKS